MLLRDKTPSKMEDATAGSSYTALYSFRKNGMPADETAYEQYAIMWWNARSEGLIASLARFLVLKDSE